MSSHNGLFYQLCRYQVEFASLIDIYRKQDQGVVTFYLRTCFKVEHDAIIKLCH